MPDFNGHLLLVSHHNSYRIAPYIKAASNLGLEITIASQGKHSLVTEVANGIHLNFEDIESCIDKVLQSHARGPFTGVLGSDDQTVKIAAHVAEALQLPHNPPEAAHRSQRKDLARAQLSLTACPVPLHCLFDLESPLERQLAGLPWPCVLKPLNMSASRGVIRADDEEAFIAACERIRPLLEDQDDSFVRTHLLIEEYIDGIEVAYEGYLHDGELRTITIFDKPDPLTGPFFAETIYVTPSALSGSQQQDIHSVIEKACQAYGLQTGAIHAECRIDGNGKIWILEVASRTIGGDCSRMLDSTGFSIEELAVSLATGQPVEVVLPTEARGVMMIPVTKRGLLKRVEGLLSAQKIEHIDKIDIIIREGNELIPLPEGNQYLGYIFASAESPELVCAALRRACENMDFIVAPIFRIS